MGAGLVPAVPDWDSGASAIAAQLLAEVAVEAEVSRLIRGMRVLCSGSTTNPGRRACAAPSSGNAIALLTSASPRALAPPSGSWLGRHAPAAPISSSGLWNVRHVGDALDPGFLDGLALLVSQAG